MRDHKECGSYAFWDLIAQEAYLSKNENLKQGTYERFLREERDKNIWMFACNEACKEWIRQYGCEYRIAGILDNSEAMWGNDISGVKVYSPKEIVPELDAAKDVIIFALRLNADIVANQIIGLGFCNIYSLGVLLADIEPYRSFIKEIRQLIENAGLSEVVLMESMNDFDGNTGALYDYLKRIGSTHRYVWICKSEVENSGKVPGKDTVLIPGRSIEDLKEYVRIRATARWEIWECDPIRKVRPDQINVFLQHYGMGYKQVAHLYNAPDYVDFVLTTNPFVREMEEKSITYGKNTQFIYGELPRNDALIGKWDELQKITEGKHYRKVVMWAPTLRESRYYRRVDSDIFYPYGISLIYEEEQMKMLNEKLKQYEMLLIIKIHPRQRINFQENNYSNIVYLDGDSIKKVRAYELLSQMDALISDYSSIVFDFMLLDRPIAWVLEDREHYKIEYLMDDPERFMPGVKIFTMEDMLRFLKSVDEEEDPYREERRRICMKCNPPFEGRGCERLVKVLGL